MPKPHYEVATYRAQENIGHLLKCARSLAMNVMEPVLEARGFTFLQYTILAWLRDGIAMNPRDISWETWQSEIVTLLQMDLGGESSRDIRLEDVDWPSWHGF
jgi:hypothetical protein